MEYACGSERAWWMSMLRSRNSSVVELNRLLLVFGSTMSSGPGRTASITCAGDRHPYRVTDLQAGNPRRSPSRRRPATDVNM